MTDEQIEKERELVKKMAGAKTAMEASLSRIRTLESALFEMHSRYSEIAKCVGDGAFVLSRFHGGYSSSDEPKQTKVSDLKKAMDLLLKKHTGPVS